MNVTVPKRTYDDIQRMWVIPTTGSWTIGLEYTDGKVVYLSTDIFDDVLDRINKQLEGGDV